MSYILDALKKIEHEKNKRNLPDGRINISGDLFQERNHPVAWFGAWKVITLIVVASLLACAGTWLVLQGNGKKSASVIRPAAAPPPAVTNLLVVAPPVPAPVQPLSAPVAVPPAVVPVPPKRGETVADDEAPVREERRLKKQVKSQPSSQKQSAPTVQAPADIKLSGIAWQDDRAARRAVINGFLLKEGAVISGAKITDIQSNKVRFSTPSGVFDIKLDSVLPAEALK